MIFRDIDPPKKSFQVVKSFHVCCDIEDPMLKMNNCFFENIPSDEKIKIYKKKGKKYKLKESYNRFSGKKNRKSRSYNNQWGQT